MCKQLHLGVFSSAPEALKLDAVGAHKGSKGTEFRSHLDSEAQLFLHFTAERLLWPFAGFYLSSSEFPFQACWSAGFASGYQDMLTILDDACDYVDYFTHAGC